MRDGTESISMAITGSALNSEGKIKGFCNSEGKIKGFCDKISRAAI